jgi:DNA-binding NarL/FixJ family response regulator
LASNNVCDVTSIMRRITVLLADDNRVVRKEFRKILELEDDFEVVGEAKNGRQAVAMVKRLRPAIVLMDVAMPQLDGLVATRDILKAVPATKVLMLSVHSDDAYVEEATNSGAMGYLIKQTCADCVCPAIRKVHKGNTFFSPSIPERLAHRNRRG